MGVGSSHMSTPLSVALLLDGTTIGSTIISTTGGQPSGPILNVSGSMVALGVGGGSTQGIEVAGNLSGTGLTPGDAITVYGGPAGTVTGVVGSQGYFATRMTFPAGTYTLYATDTTTGLSTNSVTVTSTPLITEPPVLSSSVEYGSGQCLIRTPLTSGGTFYVAGTILFAVTGGTPNGFVNFNFGPMDFPADLQRFDANGNFNFGFSSGQFDSYVGHTYQFSIIDWASNISSNPITITFESGSYPVPTVPPVLTVNGQGSGGYSATASGQPLSVTITGGYPTGQAWIQYGGTNNTITFDINGNWSGAVTITGGSGSIGVIQVYDICSQLTSDFVWVFINSGSASVPLVLTAEFAAGVPGSTGEQHAYVMAYLSGYSVRSGDTIRLYAYQTAYNGAQALDGSYIHFPQGATVDIGSGTLNAQGVVIIPFSLSSVPAVASSEWVTEQPNYPGFVPYSALPPGYGVIIVDVSADASLGPQPSASLTVETSRGVGVVYATTGTATSNVPTTVTVTQSA